MTQQGEGWTDPDIRFGTAAEWTAFRARNARFLERFARLRDALNAAFIRTLSKVEKTEVLVFFIGRQCVDDFFEILVLCGNSEGYGAQKLLRSMFERVVLLKHLHQHPEEVDRYFAYYHVTKHKQIAAVERFWGKDALPREQVEEARKRYAAVKEDYRTRKCPKCGYIEMGVGWTPIPLPDMAEEVGLGKFVPFAYYEPLLQAHPSLEGLLRRLEGDPNDEHAGISYGDRLDRSLSDQVLMTAHALLLNVLEVQVNHFKLEEEPYQSLADDFRYVWVKADVEPQGPLPDSGQPGKSD
jgi:hypothetical protein